jgi:hypothetical protein
MSSIFGQKQEKRTKWPGLRTALLGCALKGMKVALAVFARLDDSAAFSSQLGKIFPFENSPMVGR